jgi:hypothetical protein
MYGMAIAERSVLLGDLMRRLKGAQTRVHAAAW